jgi:hypothetical protein
MFSLGSESETSLGVPCLRHHVVHLHQMRAQCFRSVNAQFACPSDRIARRSPHVTAVYKIPSCDRLTSYIVFRNATVKKAGSNLDPFSELLCADRIACIAQLYNMQCIPGPVKRLEVRVKTWNRQTKPLRMLRDDWTRFILVFVVISHRGVAAPALRLSTVCSTCQTKWRDTTTGMF